MSNQKYNSEKSLKNAFDNLDMGFDPEAFAKFEEALDQGAAKEPAASKTKNRKELLGLLLLALLLIGFFYGYKQFTSNDNLVATQTTAKQSNTSIESLSEFIEDGNLTSTKTATKESSASIEETSPSIATIAPSTAGGESVEDNKARQQTAKESNNNIQGNNTNELSGKTATNNSQSTLSLKSNWSAQNDQESTVLDQAFNPKMSNLNATINQVTKEAFNPNSIAKSRTQELPNLPEEITKPNDSADSKSNVVSSDDVVLSNQYQSANEENELANTTTNKRTRFNTKIQLSQVVPLKKINAQLSHLQIEKSAEDLFAESKDQETMSEVKEERKSKSSKKKAKRKKKKRKMMSLTDIYQLTKERGYLYGGVDVVAYSTVLETNQLEYTKLDKKYDYTLRARIGYQFNENISLELNYMPINYQYNLTVASSTEYELFKAHLISVTAIHAINLLRDKILMTPRLGYTYGIRSNQTDRLSTNHIGNGYSLIETGLGLQAYFAKRWSANINYSYFAGLNTISHLNYININEGVTLATKGSFTAIQVGLRYDLNF